MLIECLIKRDGPTRINLHGFHYEFKKNGQGHYVAQVNSREHRDYLLSLPDFRIYESSLETLPVVTERDGEYFEHPPRLPEPFVIPGTPKGDRTDGNGKRSYRRRKTDRSG